jgi:hypothetical protein
LILSALDQQLQYAQAKGEIDKETLELCIKGASMLAESRATKGRISSWIQRAQIQPTQFIMTWVDDQDLDDASENEPL